MAAPKNLFSSINSCNTEHIFMGNSSPLPLQGQCPIEIIDDMINNVLYVPNLSTNLLSIYQITNLVSRKTILFTLYFCFMKLRTLHNCCHRESGSSCTLELIFSFCSRASSQCITWSLN